LSSAPSRLTSKFSSFCTNRRRARASTISSAQRQTAIVTLRDRSPQKIAVFYNSATDERVVLEEAARSVGRIATKATDGSLAWAPLLPPETLNESVIARASAKNPAGAKTLQELEQIRELHAGLASIARQP